MDSNASDFDGEIRFAVTRMAKRSLLRPQDGLLLVSFKLFSKLYLCYHSHCFPKIMKRLGKLADSLLAATCSSYETERDHAPQFKMAIDIYHVLWMCLQIGTYSLTYVLAISQSHTVLKGEILFVLLVFPISRMYELLAFITLLHSDEQYFPSASIRAIFNTVFHYCEVVVAFATLYLAAYYWSEDQFVDEGVIGNGIAECFVDPLYFSFVTITTLGYGDFSPQTWVGKTMVMSEILLGVFLLIIVLQRAMSSVGASKFKRGRTRVKKYPAPQKNTPLRTRT